MMMQKEDQIRVKTVHPGLIKRIKKGIKIILSGWQGTNFPVAYTEQDKS